MKLQRFAMMTVGLLTILALTGRPAQAQIVIVGDTFTQNPGDLSGSGLNRPVETPQTPGDSWGQNNTASGNAVVGSGVLTLGLDGGYAKAIAPFSSAGITTSYTLSYTLTFNPGADNAGMTFYGGFGNDTGNGGGSAYADSAGSLMFSFHSNTTGTSFTLNAVNAEAVGGGGPLFSAPIGSTTITRADTSTAYSMNLAITFDPTTDTADYFVDGTSIGTTSYTGPIGGLWFKGDNITGGGDWTGFEISNFEVTTEAIPEPSTYPLLLGGILLLAVAVRRRRQSV